MVDIERDLGRVETIASLTTTTCVVSALAVGSLSDQKFRNHWVVRADSTALADRTRAVSAFTASSGTLTHAGANYTDTTATSKLVEILAYEPYLFDRAINEAVQQLRRENRTILPTIQGAYEYWLTDLDWITGPDDLKKVQFSTRPVISRNRYFEDWPTYDTAGSLTPAFWTLTGASATIARNTFRTSSGVEGRTRYGLSLTRAGTNAVLAQNLGLSLTGVSGDSLAGTTVTAVLRGVSSAASSLRIQLSDEAAINTNSSYHTGGGAIEELTAVHTVDAAPTNLQVSIRLETDETAYIDEAYVVYGTLDDAMRRDSYPETEVPFTFDQGGITPKLILPVQSKGSQYIVTSTRGYPAFDATRLRSGAADADTTDAPELDAAFGALAILFEGLRGRRNEDTEKFAALAADYRRRFDRLQTGHQANNEPVIRQPVTTTGPLMRGRL